ncbi:alkylhydroperoxidase [Pandoraea capi]|uniref:Alkylhydroperoxidase n=1 Tax=Pandoraea capi TaxID=2508286 RepID=A0ABY6VR45_9BURK|nr:carboxymuconolactone decarboxylase family protein [Pandoraea capi]VVD78445.1 alkylhydroperoxidase [Pandoraea capi]
MSTLRLSYYTLSSEAYQGFAATKKALEKSTLGKALIELVYLRTSQINGCSFCLEMHAKALRKDGMPDHKIDSLAGWRVSSHYSARERAALEWTESVVAIDQTHAPDEAFDPLREHFNDTEIADLTFAIALMSAFNRLAIGMRQ